MHSNIYTPLRVNLTPLKGVKYNGVNFTRKQNNGVNFTHKRHNQNNRVNFTSYFYITINRIVGVKISSNIPPSLYSACVI